MILIILSGKIDHLTVTQHINVGPETFQTDIFHGSHKLKIAGLPRILHAAHLVYGIKAIKKHLGELQSHTFTPVHFVTDTLRLEPMAPYTGSDINLWQITAFCHTLLFIHIPKGMKTCLYFRIGVQCMGNRLTDRYRLGLHKLRRAQAEQHDCHGNGLQVFIVRVFHNLGYRGL